MPKEAWIWCAGAGVVALGLLLAAFRALRRKRLVENVPTSKVKGVFLGLNEVKGVVECAEPLTSPLAERACVFYRYEVSEQWSRTETYTDSEGQTETRTERGWTTLDSGEHRVPFHLRDETGRLRIEPEGAEVDAETVLSRTCDPTHPLYYDKGPPEAIPGSTHDRRFLERIVPTGARVYVMGSARLREDRVEPEIAADDQAELFLVSMKRESQITRGYAWGAFFALLFGAAAAFLFVAPLFDAPGRGFRGAVRESLPLAVPVTAAYLGAAALYYMVLVYNGLVALRQRAERAESLIDVQLERRHDLIPRLAACVRAFADHERRTQEHLAGTRLAGARGPGIREAEREAARQTEALRSIYAVVERYPQVRADALFTRLQEELSDTEDRIALAREFLNGSIRALNDRAGTFPDALVARLAGVRPRPFFAADALDRSPVRVRLRDR